MVKAFNPRILNIISNFRPHESIPINNKGPSWFYIKIASFIQETNKSYKNLCNKNKKSHLYQDDWYICKISCISQVTLNTNAISEWLQN